MNMLLALGKLLTKARLRPLLLPALLLSCCGLGGCWDQRQISDLAVVMGAGIDIISPAQAVHGETVQLTVELAHINTKNSEGVAVLATANGQTVSDAVRNLAQSLDHQLHWSHLQMVLIGEEAARAGVEQYLSMFYNNRDMGPQVFFALTEGTARQALAGRAGLSAYAAGGLRDILLKQRHDANGYVIPLSLQRYMIEHSLPHSGVAVPLVAIGEQLQQGEEERSSLYFRGLAILDEQGKYAGRLYFEENCGAALFLQQAQDYVVVLWEPNMQQKVTVELTSWQVSKEWKFQPLTGRIKLKLTGKAKGVLVGQQEAVRYDDQAAVEHLQQLFEKQLERQIRAVWRRAQAMQVDFLGLGGDIFRRHTEEWDKLLATWPRNLEHIELIVEIESQVSVAGQSR